MESQKDPFEGYNDSRIRFCSRLVLIVFCILMGNNARVFADEKDRDATIAIVVDSDAAATLPATPTQPAFVQEKVNLVCVPHTAIGAEACKLVGEELKKPESPLKNSSNYRIKYSIVRGLISFSAVTATVMLDRHANFGAAAVQGASAGVWSFGMQYWNKEFLAWLASDGRLSPFMKKAVSSTIYAALLHSGLATTGLAKEWVSLAVVKKVAKAVALSLFTQTYWQMLNHRWTKAAIEANPENEAIYRRNSARGSLLQSVVAVVNNSLNVSESNAGVVLTGLVGGSGFIMNQVDKNAPGMAAWLIPLRKRRRRENVLCEDALKELMN
jgi:hypothetical protein